MFQIEQQGSVKVIRGSAPLNGENAPAVVGICTPLWKSGQPKLVFDLGGVPLVDSQGLELLLDIRDQCAARGGALVLAHPNPLVGEILTATGVLDGIAVFGDAVSAAGSFVQ